MLIKAATVMLVYALAMMGLGWLTFHVAPPGSNAWTALFVTGGIGAASLVCAVMTVLGRGNHKIGMLGVHLGLVIPLIGAAGGFMRLSSSLDKTAVYNTKLEAEESMIVAKSGEGAMRNTAYQTVALGATGGLSVMAFVSLIMHRPKVPRDHEESAPTGETIA